MTLESSWESMPAGMEIAKDKTVVPNNSIVQFFNAMHCYTLGR
jgi:hypothetical protein